MGKAHKQQNTAKLRKNQHQNYRLQINFHHSRSATYNMMKMIEKNEPELIFVQEPYEYQNRTVGFEKCAEHLLLETGKPRVAIVIPNNKIDAVHITRA